MHLVNKRPDAATIISAILLLIIIVLCIKYCGKKHSVYTQLEFEQYKKEEADKDRHYQDTIDFIKGERDLWAERASATQIELFGIESRFDDLSKKHQETKKKLKSTSGIGSNDTGFVLAPNEYVDECEDCFKKGDSIKKENKQLKFERDSYEDLMRKQSSVDSARITDLNRSNNTLLSRMDSVLDIDPVTRKLKFSIIGGGWQSPLSIGGGGGFLYEDKKDNTFGAHVIFSTYKPLYLFNYAKTISFRRKKK